VVDTAQSAYHVLFQARDFLRSYMNGAGELGVINGESTVDGHAAPEVQPSDILTGDGRIPPQSAQWVVLSISAAPERLGLNIGVSRTTYRLSVIAGLRSQTWTTTAINTAAVTTDDAGWLRAHLLARAAHSVIQRHLQTTTGVINVTHAGTSQRAAGTKKPGVYEVENRFDVLVRTDNTAFS
jgi:hypothetical protein